MMNTNNVGPYSSSSANTGDIPASSTPPPEFFAQQLIANTNQVANQTPTLNERTLKQIEQGLIYSVEHFGKSVIYSLYLTLKEAEEALLKDGNNVTREILTNLVKGGAIVYNGAKIALKDIQEGSLVLLDGLLYVMRGGILSLKFSLLTIPAQILGNALPQTPGDVIFFSIAYMGTTALAFPYASGVATIILEHLGTHLASFYQLGRFTAPLFQLGLKQAYASPLSTTLTFATGGVTAFSVLCALHLIYQFLQWMQTEKPTEKPAEDPIPKELSLLENILEQLNTIKTNYKFDPTAKRVVLSNTNINPMMQSWQMVDSPFPTMKDETNLVPKSEDEANPFQKTQDVLDLVVARETEAKADVTRKAEADALAVLRRSLEKFLKSVDNTR